MPGGVAVTISNPQATDVPANMGTRRSTAVQRRGRMSDARDTRVGVAGGGVPRGAADRAGHRDVGPASDGAGGRLSRARFDDRAVGLRAEVLAEAESVLLVHVAGVDGHCAGCADRCWFALAPCLVSRWARSVIGTHGVAVWDARPAGCAEGLSLTPLDAGEAPSLSRVAV
jgi:hypothetical protein